jgi:hypothetical protein
MREADRYGLKASAKVKDDIADLAHVHGNYLARYPEYEGKTTGGRSRKPGAGIRTVKGLEPSIEWLLARIRKLLSVRFLTAPSYERTPGKR